MAFLGLVMMLDSSIGPGSPAPGNSAAPAGGDPGPGVPAPAVVAAPAPPPRAQLPRGGIEIFPRNRVVALYGSAGTDSLGVLGEGTPEEAADRLDQMAAPFATPGREVQPTMELIVGVADSSPGPDGDYHHDIDESEARRYLDVARAHRQLVVLDIQPGRSDFRTAVRPWENMLREPDVSLALDAEWRMGPDEVPGEVIGSVTADEVNQTTTWLADMVRTNNLPQKMLVLHQFTGDMIQNPEKLTAPPELALVQHVDGFGGQAEKLGKYAALQRPQQFHEGFKLFIDEDTPMLTPEQTLALSPTPEFITYQ